MKGKWLKKVSTPTMKQRNAYTKLQEEGNAWELLEENMGGNED